MSTSGQNLIVRPIVRPDLHGWNASGVLGCPGNVLKRVEENILSIGSPCTDCKKTNEDSVYSNYEEKKLFIHEVGVGNRKGGGVCN